MYRKGCIPVKAKVDSFCNVLCVQQDNTPLSQNLKRDSGVGFLILVVSVSQVFPVLRMRPETETAWWKSSLAKGDTSVMM